VKDNTSEQQPLDLLLDYLDCIVPEVSCFDHAAALVLPTVDLAGKGTHEMRLCRQSNVAPQL
jgi:hypothetical protein